MLLIKTKYVIDVKFFFDFFTLDVSLSYVGQHDNQIYVLPSDLLKKEIKSVINYASILHSPIPQLHWSPVPR